MRPFRIIAILLPALLPLSCSTVTHKAPPEILHTVPTDAVTVYCSDRLGSVLEMAFDSTDVVNTLGWGKLSGRQAAVSFVFNRKLSPVLCIDAGKASEDTLEEVHTILRQAGRSGFQARYFPGTQIGRSCNLLLLTRSESVHSAVLRHLDAGRSIMDVQDFVSALGLAEGQDAQLVRASSFDQIFPPGYLSTCFRRAEILKLARNCAEWIVILNGEDGTRTIRTFQHEDGSQFANVLPKLADAESRLPEILPEDAVFALSLPIGEGWRKTYEDWRYACSSLDRYRKELTAVKGATKQDALKWEKQSGVREVAVIQRGDGSRILAVRAVNLPDTTGVFVNRLRGIPAALYGSAFASVTDSCGIRKGDWLICGTDKDLRAFDGAAACTQPLPGWPVGPCRFVIRYNGHTMSADADAITVSE